MNRRPRFRAEFFVTPGGTILKKAKSLTYKQRKYIYNRDNGICKKCGRQVKYCGGTSPSPYTDPPSSIDHIFPVSRGGQNNPENLRLLCVTCNAQRNAVWKI